MLGLLDLRQEEQERQQPNACRTIGEEERSKGHEGHTDGGEPASLRRAHGLERRALVHHLHRALLVDFGVDEWFGLNVFLRDGDDVYRTYFLQHGPMVQSIGSVWTVFSLTPYGGQCDDEDLPEGWPAAPQSFWYRRHDEFNDPPPSATGG